MRQQPSALLLLHRPFHIVAAAAARLKKKLRVSGAEVPERKRSQTQEDTLSDFKVSKVNFFIGHWSMAN